MEQTSEMQPQRMQCLEIRGGNRAIDQSFAVPGMNVYIRSAPYAKSQTGGGDLYYLTSCASGRITRLLLADVSGHGAAASELAISLRDLLRNNVNTINQDRFVKQMNREFGRLADDSGFATAVAVTYFAPRQQLSVGLAGHPNPIFFQSRQRRWLTVDHCKNEHAVGNLPLGVDQQATYSGRVIETKPGDMLLLYSDAFIEAIDQNERPIGIAGLISLLNQLKNRSPAQVVSELFAHIQSMSPASLAEDDATLILCEFTRTKVRFRDNLLAPFRLLRHANDRTQFENRAR